MTTTASETDTLLALAVRDRECGGYACDESGCSGQPTCKCKGTGTNGMPLLASVAFPQGLRAPCAPGRHDPPDCVTRGWVVREHDVVEALLEWVYEQPYPKPGEMMATLDQFVSLENTVREAMLATVALWLLRAKK